MSVGRSAVGRSAVGRSAVGLLSVCCRSVGRSVGPSVGPSVPKTDRLLVRRTSHCATPPLSVEAGVTHIIQQVNRVWYKCIILSHNFR